MRLAGSLGAEDYTPEITEGKFHWKVPLKIHGTILVTIHCKSDNPLGYATEM